MGGETHAGQEMRSCVGSRRRSLAESERVRTRSLLLSRERGTVLNKNLVASAGASAVGEWLGGIVDNARFYLVFGVECGRLH